MQQWPLKLNEAPKARQRLYSNPYHCLLLGLLLFSFDFSFDSCAFVFFSELAVNFCFSNIFFYDNMHTHTKKAQLQNHFRYVFPFLEKSN